MNLMNASKIIYLALISLIIISLSGCIPAPTRKDKEAFELLREGNIATKDVLSFSDCLLDGFGRAHFMLTWVSARHQRRSNSFRIESLVAGTDIIISADVFDDGRVALYESEVAKFINTSGERKSFDKCMAEYSVARKN